MGGGRRAVRMRVAHVILAALCALTVGCSSPGSRHDPNPQVYGLHDRVPEGGGRYKVGDAYNVGGQRFYPREDPSYDRTGVASWYGEYFHGRKTANGEWYDMNRMSAAHPTLPLPVYARVTNMQNGRSLVVRVNDRGPFKRDRIIDLSKGAATQLGMVKAGTAPVRVTYIGRAPLEGDVSNMQTVDRRGTSWLSPFSTAALDSGQGGDGVAPRPAPVAAGSTAALDVPTTTGALAPRPVPANVAESSAAPQKILPQGLYVQVASFTNENRARSLADELSHLGSFAVLPAEVAGDTYYRVRLGPVANYSEAQSMVGTLETEGLPGGRIFEQ